MGGPRRLNPSFPPVTKGSPAFRGIWKRGVRGDFGRIGLVNYDGFVKSPSAALRFTFVVEE
ncbi:MAG: hypothetical protein NTY64_08730 [Deltaproteobacteria bacterium]|nr:hypothetical protein [Deltaproteobacteria bacterium]